MSTWTRFMRRSSSGTIRSCGASPSSSPGTATAPSSARLRTRPGLSACARPCRPYARNACVPMRSSSLRISRAIGRSRRACGRSSSVTPTWSSHCRSTKPTSTSPRTRPAYRPRRGRAHNPEQIREELNLTASAGVAPNKFLAKIASDWRKPDGLFVIQPEEIDAFLLPLPVGRLPGVGKVTGEKLAKLGIKTVGDLRSLDLLTRRQLRPLWSCACTNSPAVSTTMKSSRTGLRNRSQSRILLKGRPLGRNRAHDPAPGRKALVCFAQGITRSADGSPQNEDKRV